MKYCFVAIGGDLEHRSTSDYQEDEYLLLGMAIKYAGLRGKEVRVIGKNRSSLGEDERVQVKWD